MTANHLALRRESESLALLSSISRERLAVSFSGGKDSLVALDIAYRVGIRKAVFCDTTIEFPETVKYVREVGDFYGLEIDIVRSRVAFFDIAREIGIPSRRARWCCDVFKFGPLADYARKEGLYGFITGLRRDESKRRRNYKSTDRVFLIPARQINPILDWNLQDVWDYVCRYGLPLNPLYETFDRVGCWCCPYRTAGDWRQIGSMHPDLMETFEALLKENSYTVPAEHRESYSNDGWSSWVTPQRKIQMGISEPCQSRAEGESTFVLTLYSESHVRRVERVIPIVSRDHRTIGKRIRITLPTDLRDKTRILLEKALNCVGCDVCPAMCPTGALSCSEDGLRVAEGLCTQCLKCLSASVHTLRGACIARNYASKKGVLVQA